MRWDNLRLDADERDERVTLPLFDQGAVVRTFYTPEFRGMTFYEVRAKSIINRVPEASHVPFRWTINPYRGCSHACVWCVSGDTPVLMADGRWKPIADIRPADKVYGTVLDGNYRRYLTTHVRAHWRTVKPACRIRLEDGTELIASGDHRFLTTRGWKFVTGREQGRERRPYLTLNNKLMGTGRFAAQPEDTPEYRRGYLCGLIRGDGYLRSRSYGRPSGGRWTSHHFRLALVDLEPLRRARRYLGDVNVSTSEFLFQQAAGARREMRAIRAQSRPAVSTVRRLVRWPRSPSLDWQRGFLAGIFDAEGSFSETILRISNTDPEIIDHVSSGLGRFGFSFAIEPSGGANGLAAVRIRGGLAEHLRFFHLTDPAITRKRSIEGRAIKHRSKLRVTSIEPLGMELPMYDITTGTGDFIADGVVSHNCFARKSHTYLDLNYGEDFDTKIVVKVNAPERLRKELAAPKWTGEHIAMGTNVDPYQRAEGRYKLMRGILEGLRDFANPFSILTKGTLIRRDIDLLQRCAEVADVGTNFSVGTIDPELWRAMEPGTPSPAKRLEAVRRLNEAGIPCGVLMGPIVPFLSDDEEHLTETVRAIAEAGATHVSPIVLHLRSGGSREWWMGWVNEHRPDLVPRYEELYGGKAYAPKAYQREVSERVRRLARRFRVGQRTGAAARRIRERSEEPPPTPEQLNLL
ncbi:MAG: intein-containing Rv2578c family radical SAM protein [Actinomycetota bacterium]